MEKDTEQKNSQTVVQPEVSAPVFIPEATVETTVSAAESAAVAAPATSSIAPAFGARTPDKRNPREFKKNVRKGPRRESKVKPEFDQKIISVRRVTRVVTGGRRFSFSVAVVAGNRKGSVGVGLGKAGDTSIAIEKALRNAKKNMITVSLNKHQSIPHEVSAKFSASRVVIMPAPGRGIIAGSSVRTVLELAGIKDISAKIRSGSKSKINNAKVAIEALKMLPKTKIGVAPAVKASLEKAIEKVVASVMEGKVAGAETKETKQPETMAAEAKV